MLVFQYIRVYIAGCKQKLFNDNIETIRLYLSNRIVKKPAQILAYNIMSIGARYYRRVKLIAYIEHISHPDESR